MIFTGILSFLEAWSQLVQAKVNSASQCVERGEGRAVLESTTHERSENVQVPRSI